MEASINKKEFVICYDYGQGGLWAIIFAPSEAAVKDRFRDIKVFSERPAWIDDDTYARLDRVDIHGDSSGWLVKVDRGISS